MDPLVLVKVEPDLPPIINAQAINEGFTSTDQVRKTYPAASGTHKPKLPKLSPASQPRQAPPVDLPIPALVPVVKPRIDPILLAQQLPALVHFARTRHTLAAQPETARGFKAQKTSVLVQDAGLRPADAVPISAKEMPALVPATAAQSMPALVQTNPVCSTQPKKRGRVAQPKKPVSIAQPKKNVLVSKKPLPEAVAQLKFDPDSVLQENPTPIPVQDQDQLFVSNSYGIAYEAGLNNAAFIDCIYCKIRIYGTEPELKQHKKDHVSARERPHKCDLCDKTWLTRGHLNDHILRAHTERAYECDTCHQLFKHQCDLNRHKERHLETRSYQCSICGAAFKARGALYVHRYVHMTQQQYTCKICGATFSRPDSYSRHEKYHSKKKEFQCSYCEKRFFNGAAKKEHEVVHSDETPFKCMVCNKGHKTARRLRDHMKVTHKEKQKVVELYQDGIDEDEIQLNAASSTNEVDPLGGLEPQPENSYTEEQESWCIDNIEQDNTPSELETSETNTALNTSVPGIPSSASIDYNFKCQFCLRYFESKKKLTNHIHKSHNGRGDKQDKGYECKIVDEAFAGITSLAQSHLYTGQFVNCTICGKDLANVKSMKKHLKGVHRKEFTDNEYQLTEDEDRLENMDSATSSFTIANREEGSYSPTSSHSWPEQSTLTLQYESIA